MRYGLASVINPMDNTMKNALLFMLATLVLVSTAALATDVSRGSIVRMTQPVSGMSTGGTSTPILVDSTGAMIITGILSISTSTVPSGPVNSVQYNSGGISAGVSTFLFYPATSSVSIGGPTLPGNLSIAGSSTNYVQLEIQNTNASTTASTDIVATNDTGSDGTNYIDLGINSSNYAAPAYSIAGAGGGYLYTSDGDLAIGTASSTKVLKFHVGGTQSTNLVATVSSTGLQLAPNMNFMAYGSNGTSTYSLHGPTSTSGGVNWQRAESIAFATATTSTASTTGVAIPGLTWGAAANAAYSFTCFLTSANSVATSAVRFAVSTPASPTLVSYNTIEFPMSVVTSTTESISVPWTTPCTGCTAAVTAGVTTATTLWTLQGNIVNGATAGSIQVYYAASAAATSTVYAGSNCTWWSNQ